MDIDPVLNFLYRLLGDQVGFGLRVFSESNIDFWLGNYPLKGSKVR
jgi:hypothetical protein